MFKRKGTAFVDFTWPNIDKNMTQHGHTYMALCKKLGHDTAWTIQQINFFFKYVNEINVQFNLDSQERCSNGSKNYL